MNGQEQILERLARIEEKLDRTATLGEQLGNFGRTWESLSDLGRDLSLVMGPGATLLTEELAEVETGFQVEDALYLLKRLLLSFRHIAWSLEQLENLIDWWQDLEPLLKIAVPHLVDKLDDLEQKGIFKINAAVLDMYGKIAQHYTPEDIATIGDGFVRVHGLVKKFSDPDFIKVIEKLTDVPMEIDLEASQPVGPVGLVFRMQNQECRQGLGIIVELTRALGKIKNGQTQSASPET